MRYCDNCGAELSEDAEFCDECGSKVEELEQKKQNTGTQTKPKKNRKTPVIIISVMLVVCIAGVAGYFLYSNYSGKAKQTDTGKTTSKKESVIKRDNLLESVPWEKDSEETTKKIIKFKEHSLTDYSDVPLKTAYDSEIITVIKEQYKKLDDTEYYGIDYNYDNQNYVAIVLKEKEKTELAELYHNDKKVALNSDEWKAYQEEVFKTTYAKVIEEKKKAEEESDSKFIGHSGTYQISDATLNSVITVTVLTEEMIKVEMNISNHAYDLEFKGKILSENTAQIILDAGEEVNIVWENSEEFTTIPLNGFTGESTHMMPQMCECLNNQTYKSASNVNASNTPQSASVSIASGTFWQQDKSPDFSMHNIEISNVTPTSFDFEIFGRNAQGENFRTVFRHHTATYIDANTAVYNGEQYTLTFQCYDPGYVTISGFSEWIPDGSTLYNNDYLGVS